jgi:(p)ppGpp synthase/HD superfamily hydrolase
MSFSSDTYLHALHFAARAHGEQKMLTGFPYVVHLSCVAMEVACALRKEQGHDEDLAIVCAVLHDVVEDTPTSLDQVAHAFGARVAAGVGALTKNAALAPELQMRDSLDRILQQPNEIAIVKLADRIANTAAPPPHWTSAQIAFYRKEAEEILDALGPASLFLGERLRRRITNYGDALGQAKR